MIGITIGLILIIGLLAYYYCGYIKNIFKLIKVKENKRNRILGIVIGISLALLCLNFQSILGIFLLYLALSSLLLDIILLIIKSITKSSIFGKPSIHILYIIPLLFTIFICVYGYYNMTNIVETNYSFSTTKKINEKLKVALLADSHYGPLFNKAKLKELVNELNNIEGLDIVLLAGDIIEENTTKSEMNEIFDELGKIKSKYGIYYVYGNHDRQYYSQDRKYSVEELNEAIEKNNIEILQDEVYKVNDYINIIGREDKSLSRKSITELINASMQDTYNIVIDHQPTEYSEVSSAGGDLIVSGHTHGGQIFPIEYFINTLKTSDLAYENKKEGTLEAVVTSGVSGWGYPIRTSHHSEYVIINIKEK